jgi:hypothetical protein
MANEANKIKLNKTKSTKESQISNKCKKRWKCYE